MDRRHGHLTMDSPSHPREGEPVLRSAPSAGRVPSPRWKRARVRRAAPASTSRLHPGSAPISETTTEAMFVRVRAVALAG